MATYSSNTTVKMSGAASSGQTLASNQYAIVSYGNTTVGTVASVSNVYYGPGQTIAATVSVSDAGVTQSFLRGVVFQNTP